RLFAPEPSSKPPGQELPARGVTSTVDPLVDFDDAWSFAMSPGIAYRINLAPARDKCVGLALYRPGTRSFAESQPLHSLHCGGYFTLTPGPGAGGRYSLLVTANGTRAGAQRYRLSAAVTGADDTAPGLPLANLRTRRGSLDGRALDVVDLYRFDVETRSDVTLGLREPSSASFDLQLLTDTGRRLGCEGGFSGRRKLNKQLPTGHYLVVVRARRFTRGPYALSLLVRQITTAHVSFGNGKAAPRQAVSVTAHITLATGGHLTMRIERFDPLMGWQYAPRYPLPVSGGGNPTAPCAPPTTARRR